MIKEPGKARYEYCTEISSKFWEPQLKGNELTVRFGRIGTDGQTHTKTFSSPEKAVAEYRKLVCEKLAKGYKPTVKTVAALLDNAVSVENPRAIASVYIGEHVPDEVVTDICGWTTACIQHGMTLKQFKSIWEMLTGEENEELSDALEWFDDTAWDESELYELYAKAIEDGGDRFIWFDNNAYIDIVALRGDPGARAIEVCVLQEEGCKDDEVQWLGNWSDELGIGAPIASMSCDDVMLRDGRRCR